MPSSFPAKMSRSEEKILNNFPIRKTANSQIITRQKSFAFAFHDSQKQIKQLRVRTYKKVYRQQPFSRNVKTLKVNKYYAEMIQRNMG